MATAYVKSFNFIKENIMTDSSRNIILIKFNIHSTGTTSAEVPLEVEMPLEEEMPEVNDRNGKLPARPEGHGKAHLLPMHTLT